MQTNFMLLSQHKEEKKYNKKHVSNVEKSIRHTTTFAFSLLNFRKNVPKIQIYLGKRKQLIEFLKQNKIYNFKGKKVPFL